MVSKRLPMLVCTLVGSVLLQLFSGKGGYPRTEPVGQAHDYIDVAAAAEIGVVLVGALEEDFELDV